MSVYKINYYVKIEKMYLKADNTLFFDNKISTISSLALAIRFNISRANW